MGKGLYFIENYDKKSSIITKNPNYDYIPDLNHVDYGFRYSSDYL
jgi:hypothetical protein